MERRTHTVGFFDITIVDADETEVEVVVLDALFGFC